MGDVFGTRQAQCRLLPPLTGRLAATTGSWAKAVAPWAYQAALSQVRISRPEQLRRFDACNRTAGGAEKPCAEHVKPFNFLGHAMPKPLTALPAGVAPGRFCLVAPAGERGRFVNRHDPKGGVYAVGTDFTPKTYADLVEAYDVHPERKFAGADGAPCRPETQGLLRDLPIVVSGIRHVGKEGNALEEHKAGLTTEPERQLEYHDSEHDDLRLVLDVMETGPLARAAGYKDDGSVRRIKRGARLPGKAGGARLVELAAGHARERLETMGYPVPAGDREAIGVYAGVLRRNGARGDS